jgi:hypothetical protein
MSTINKLIKQCRDRLAEFEPDFKIPMPLIFEASRKAPNKNRYVLHAMLPICCSSRQM